MEEQKEKMAKRKSERRDVYVDVVFVLNKGLFYSERPQDMEETGPHCCTKPIGLY
jgi:hypothetical protein